MSEGEKVCSWCGVSKPHSEFSRNGTHKGQPRWHSVCKQCRREKEAERRRLDPTGYHAAKRASYERARARRNELRRNELYITPDNVRANSRSYYARHKEEHRRRVANCNFKRQYGITLADYERMYQSQEGCCLICGVHLDKLLVDHDHNSGVVRGLLCHPCNSALGMIHDDQIVALKMARYLSAEAGLRRLFEGVNLANFRDSMELR